MAEQSSRCPQRLFIPARPASISGQTPQGPLGPAAAASAAPRAGPSRRGREGSARATPCWWPPKRRSCRGQLRWHCSVTSGGAGGARWPFCLLPSLLRACPRSGAEGWQPPGALPGGAAPLNGFCSEPPYAAPRPGKGVGSTCGASRDGRAG